MPNLRLILLILLLSGGLLTPCFWQPHIQAGDFASHLYNAWLVQKVEAGELTGLSLAPQRTNVLFDLLLAGLWRRFGMNAAEKISASALVLILSWGAFMFVGAASGRSAWPLLPVLAMLAYGFVFHMGFSNFYLSLGLCLWALAIGWRITPARAACAAAVLAVAGTAHMLPVAWAAGVLVYATVARRLTGRERTVLCAGILTGIVALHVTLRLTLPTRWSLEQAVGATGADQLWVYGGKYLLVSLPVLLLWTLLLLRRVGTEGARGIFLSIPFQIYLFTAVAVLLIPSRIHIPGYAHKLVFISHRMSLPVAIVLCACAAAARPPRWATGAFAAAALLFFSFLYQDSRALNRFERQVERLVDQLPKQQRVATGICHPGPRVDPLPHILDGVCVGRCYSFANYEPSTGQFRLRASPRNGIVVSSYADSYALQTGGYRVKDGEAPLYEIYFCGQAGSDLCVRVLRAGDVSESDCRQVLPALW